MASWNPWRGCIKCSEGCKFCFIHKGDSKRRIDTSVIRKTKGYTYPIEKDKSRNYKLPSENTVYTCFSSDFLIESADEWRPRCFEIIKERSDLNFLFLTKRIERFKEIMPEDFAGGYENLTVGCTVENQKNADFRLGIFLLLPIKHKIIICQPLLERINIEKYLSGIEAVVVGGEIDKKARPLYYDYVLYIREQCEKRGILFSFRECGTHFIKDGKEYNLSYLQSSAQAKKANIDLKKKS